MIYFFSRQIFSRESLQSKMHNEVIKRIRQTWGHPGRPLRLKWNSCDAEGIIASYANYTIATGGRYLQLPRFKFIQMGAASKS